MADNLFLAIAAIFLFLFSLISGRLKKFGVTPQMVFVGLGTLVGLSRIPSRASNIPLDLVGFIAQVALVLILFTDATYINRSRFLKNRLPLRLLFIGLPLSILAGFLIALWLFPTMTPLEAAFLSILLVPTDLALGKEIVSNTHLPHYVRESLHTESGLNDGLALPFLFLALSFSTSHNNRSTLTHWFSFLFLEIGLGVFFGLLIGIVGGNLVEKATKLRWMQPVYQRLTAISLALLAFALASFVKGNGFIATFCAGASLGIHSKTIRTRLIGFGEAEGEQLSLFIFFLFGALFIPLFWKEWTWTSLLYALLSLTVIRLIPVAISMIGTKERWETILFFGWFGPRGIASILFGLMVFKNNFEASNRVLAITFLTVFLSVFLHGLTARVGSHWYNMRMKHRTS